MLDTHIALWAIQDHPRLSGRARDLISHSEAVIWVSAVSIWEIAIKNAVGRVQLGLSAADARRYFNDAGFRFLSVSVDHTLAVEPLPLIHNDPFDRLLIAQAMAEPMRLVTSDRLLSAYGAMVEVV